MAETPTVINTSVYISTPSDEVLTPGQEEFVNRIPDLVRKTFEKIEHEFSVKINASRMMPWCDYRFRHTYQLEIYLRDDNSSLRRKYQFSIYKNDLTETFDALMGMFSDLFQEFQRNLKFEGQPDLLHLDEFVSSERDMVLVNLGSISAKTQEAVRVHAIKAGLLRGFLGVFARLTVMATHQVTNLRENIRTKGGYDASKEILKWLISNGYENTFAFVSTSVGALVALATTWPAMFNFYIPYSDFLAYNNRS